MIALTRDVPNHFHHIRLNEEFFKDLNMWKALLARWNGRSVFLDSTVTLFPDMSLYTNASGAIGFWGYFNGKWFQGRWPPHMQLNKDRVVIIEWQELFPIVVVCTFWFPHFSGKRTQFWSDNKSVVVILNSGRSRAHVLCTSCGFLSLYL